MAFNYLIKNKLHKSGVFHILVLSLFMILNTISATAQETELSWDELAGQYECPEWFRDAKFGIWFHWGPQAQPEQGGGCRENGESISFTDLRSSFRIWF